MKKQLEPKFIPMSKEEILLLTAVIKETLAKDCPVDHQKVFGAADLWNIRKQRRQNPGRRFLV